MLDGFGKIWQKMQDLLKWTGDVDKEIEKMKRELEQLAKKNELLEQGARHHGIVQDHHGKQLVELQQEVKKLKAEKQGKAISAGIAKKELERLREELKALKDPKRRH
jgi:hypothetical protein